MNIPGYTGMGFESAKGLVALMHKLWPRWSNTAELNTEWAALLADHPREVGEAVVRAHVRDRVGSPSMPQVASALKAARGQATEANAHQRAATGSVTRVTGEVKSVTEWSRWHVAYPHVWLDDQSDAVRASVERIAAASSYRVAGLCHDAKAAWTRWERERHELSRDGKAARLKDLAAMYAETELGRDIAWSKTEQETA